MQDREMLELAAKAAGMGQFIDHGHGQYTVGLHTGMREWNPLTDDGDALRLAVKLEIDIVFQRPGVEACRSHGHPSLPSFGSVRALEHDNDPCAATRRAIVRVAAEIGRAMP